MFAQCIRRTALLLLLLFGPGALADSIPASYTLNQVANFPDYYQLSDGILHGSNACAPTAMTDAFTWMAATYGLPNLISSSNFVDMVNTMGTFMGTTDAGTYLNAIGTGAQDYIRMQAHYGGKIQVNSVVPILSSGGTYTNAPTLDFLRSSLSSGMAVEFDVRYINTDGTLDGGHTMALTGYDATHLYVADPGTDGATVVNAPLSITGKFSYLGADFTLLDYNGSNVYLRSAFSERVLPEPSALSLFGTAALLFFGVRKRLLTSRRGG